MSGPFDPHPGADVALAALELRGLLRGASGEEAARGQVRLADLERRGGAPALALETLATVPSAASLGPITPAAVRCAALTEQGDVIGAEALLDQLPDALGVRALAAARLRLYGGLVDEPVAPALERARRAADAAVGHPLAIELRFEAHVVATWLALQLARDDEAEAHADAALACLDPARQPVTHGWLSFLRPHLRGYRETRLATWKVLTAQLLAGYTAPVEHHRHRLGAIPLEVHGARMMHGEDPDRYCRALLLMVLAARHGEELDKAWAIAEYGRLVGERLFGEVARERLDALREGLALALGPEASARAADRLRRVAALSDLPRGPGARPVG